MEKPPEFPSQPPPLPEKNDRAKESGEILPTLPETAAREMYAESRWRRALQSSEIRRGAAAIVRTIINTGVAAADAIPVIGDAASWAADSAKLWGPWIKALGGPNLDLTPAVSKKIAWGSELFELKTLGIAPTHALEAGLQFKREDWGRIKVAYSALRDILKAEKEDYALHKDEIDAAMATFAPEKNEKRSDENNE